MHLLTSHIVSLKRCCIIFMQDVQIEDRSSQSVDLPTAHMIYANWLHLVPLVPSSVNLIPIKMCNCAFQHHRIAFTTAAAPSTTLWQMKQYKNIISERSPLAKITYLGPTFCISPPNGDSVLRLSSILLNTTGDHDGY